MTYHNWSSDWPYFKDVEMVADEIGDFLLRYGRIPVGCTKEKFGKAMVYCSLGYVSLHTLVYPRHCYSKHPKFPNWLWFLDNKVFSRFFTLSPINKITLIHQEFIYRLAYSRAIKKYPHIKEEILVDADYPYLLKDLY